MWTWCKTQTSCWTSSEWQFFWREYLLRIALKWGILGCCSLERGCLDFVPKFPRLPINLNIASDSNVNFLPQKKRILAFQYFLFLPFQFSDLEFSVFCMFWNDILHIIRASCWNWNDTSFCRLLSFIPYFLGVSVWICLLHNKPLIITLLFLFAILNTKCFSALLLRFLFQHLLS